MSEQILSLFRETTVFIKCWASQKGIYNFNMGYLNGISIMVLVVRALKIYFNDIRYSAVRLELLRTDYSASRQATIEHFFALFSDWPW